MTEDSKNMQGKDKNITLILCILGGLIGLHHFYVGNIILGIIYLLTGGLFSIGWIIDIIRILSGIFKDCNGALLVKKEFKINKKPKIEKQPKKVEKKVEKNLLEGVIAELKGTNGKITLYEDKLVISRNTFGGFALFGNSGERTLYYHTLQGVEYTGGSLRIIPIGVNAKNYNRLDKYELYSAVTDSYSIGTPLGKKKIAEEIYNIINEKIKEAYLKTGTPIEKSNTDEIREYKKLLDDGIITQEEFEKKKQELLND